MIIIKSKREIDYLKVSNKIVAEVLAYLREVVSPGMTTEEIAVKAAIMIRKNGGESAFKGYRGFPGDICISVNEEVVHGIPSARQLREGDIVSIDVGVKKDGYFGDAAISIPVCGVSLEAQHLLEVAEQALYRGIEKIRTNKRLSSVSYAIQSYVENNGFSVVRDFVGHGIGMSMHEEPQIPNFGIPNQGPRLRSGMVLAIEPMVNAGTYEVVVKDDGWTVVTKDGKLSAHFEHSVLVTDNGPEILSQL